MNSMIKEELTGSTVNIVMATSKSQDGTDASKASLPSMRCSIPRESASSNRSNQSRNSLHSSLPTLQPPPGLISLCSLGTQHLIGYSSRFSSSESGRPDFLLTTPLSPPYSDLVVHFRPAKRSDVDQVAAVLQRSGEATLEEEEEGEQWALSATGEQVRYHPRDRRRSLRWSYSSAFHDPAVVLVVAEIANAVGHGGEKTVKREIIGILGMEWFGKAKSYDQASGERSYSGINRIQLKPILKRHLADLGSELAWALDRSGPRPRSWSRTHRDSSSASTDPPLSSPKSRTSFDHYGTAAAAAAAVASMGDKRRRNNSDLWYVLDLVVDPSYRCHGVGGRLLSLATQAVRDRGEVLVLSTIAGGDTERFCRRYGFEKFGESVEDGERWCEMVLRPEDDDNEVDEAIGAEDGDENADRDEVVIDSDDDNEDDGKR